MVRVGDRVGYSAHFLRSIQASYEISMRRGIVTELVKDVYVRVKWDDFDGEYLAHFTNIARVGTVAFSDPNYKPRA